MRETATRRFVSVLLSAAFLWTLALSASPKLHERFHSDASRVEHTCAVTFVASGTYDHAAHAPLVSAPAPLVQFSRLSALPVSWVPSAFLGSRIFEHAPPSCA